MKQQTITLALLLSSGMLMHARFENDPGILSQYDIKGLSHEAFGTDQQPYYFQPKYPSQALGQGQFTKQSGQAEIASKYGLIAQNQYQGTGQQFVQPSTQSFTQQRGQTGSQAAQPGQQQSAQYNQPGQYQSGSQYVGSPQSTYMTGQMGSQMTGQQTTMQPSQYSTQQTGYAQGQGSTTGAQTFPSLSTAAQDFISAAQSGVTGTYVPGQTTAQPVSQYQPTSYQQSSYYNQPSQYSMQPSQYQTSSSGTEAAGQTRERHMLSRHRYGYGTEITQPAGQSSSQSTIGTQTGTQSTSGSTGSR